jgi:hypothetical protein
MVYVGDIYTLGVGITLHSDIGPGVAKAKSELGQLSQSTTKTTTEFNALDLATKKNASGFKAVGTVSMMAGAGIMSMGMAAQSAGGDIAKLAPVIMALGGSMVAVGTVSQIAGPMIKAVGWAGNTAVPGIIGFTKALWASNAALTALGAATVIGAALVGLYLIYQAFNKAKEGARDLEKEIKDLSNISKDLGYRTSVITEELKTASGEYDIAADAVKGYENRLKDLRAELDKSKEATEDLIDVNLALEGLYLDQKDLAEELIEAYRNGDTSDIERIKYRQKVNKESIRDAENRKKADEDLIKKTSTIEDTITETERAQRAWLEEKIALENEVNALKKEELDANREIAKINLTSSLLELQKAGGSLTQESYDIMNRIPWMRDVLSGMPKTVQPGIDLLETVHKAFPETGGFLPGAAAAYINRSPETNPLFKGITININGTVTDKSYTLDSKTLADLGGY